MQTSIMFPETIVNQINKAVDTGDCREFIEVARQLGEYANLSEQQVKIIVAAAIKIYNCRQDAIITQYM